MSREPSNNYDRPFESVTPPLRTTPDSYSTDDPRAPHPNYHQHGHHKSLSSHLTHFFSNQPESHMLKKNYIFPPQSAPLLGSGGFSTVVKAHWKVEKIDVAIKIVPKTGIWNMPDYMKIVHAGNDLVHPHVVRLFEWFESRSKFYMVFELASGGELFDKIIEKGSFTEEEAKSAIYAILDSLHYLHTKDLIHRDIKPENFLYRNRSDPKDFVITDFGIAKVLDKGSYERERNGGEKVDLREVCGTPGYAAPEVYKKTGYSFKSDIFGVGVLTFALLSGCSPWHTINPVDIVHECLEEKPVRFPDHEWSNISQDGMYRSFRPGVGTSASASGAGQAANVGLSPLNPNANAGTGTGTGTGTGAGLSRMTSTARRRLHSQDQVGIGGIEGEDLPAYEDDIAEDVEGESSAAQGSTSSGGAGAAGTGTGTVMGPPEKAPL